MVENSRSIGIETINTGSIQSKPKNLMAAAWQARSGMNVEENLQQLATDFETLTANVDIVVLPENFALMGAKGSEHSIAEHKGSGAIQDEIARLAQRYKVWVVAGTIPLFNDNTNNDSVINNTDKVYASCLVFDPQGHIVHNYNKRHLFDVDLANGERYRESDSYIHGEIDQDSYFQSPWGKIGLSICYDLRFPEHFRQAPDDTIIHCVPAAFTYQTGKAHWETLLKARAIENQCFIIGAAQSGQHDNGRKTWGHSTIIDPWGTTINCLPEHLGFCFAEIDLERLHEIRQALPCLQHKRL